MPIYDIEGNEISSGGGGTSSKLATKSVIAFGDSLIQYQGTQLFRYAVSLYGLETYRNEGHAGADWINAKTYVDDLLVSPADSTTLLNENYDIITFAFGTNNSNTDTYGTPDDPITANNMCGATKYCLENALYYCRRAKIGAIIPPQREEGNDVQKTRNALLRQIFENYSIPYLDLEKAGQIVPDNVNSVASALGKSQYYLGDGLHLGDNGASNYQYKYAEFIASLV